MASLVEQQLAACRERVLPIAAAPDGGGEGERDPRLTKMAAALRGRMASYREWKAAESPAVSSAVSLALKTFSRQGTREQLKGLKDQLRDLQSQLAETLSIQLCKETKGKLTTESISDTTAMVERLGNSVADLRDKRDKRTAVISEQLQALEPLEAKSNEDAALLEKLEEAIFWYEKFLGFQIVGQYEGVKFAFNKIDPQSPEKEYSFCINLDKDRYNLLRCDPHIKDVEELVKDLNLSDNVAKFLRIIREKLQSSSMNGTLPISPVIGPEESTEPPSPMVTSVDGRSEDVSNQSLSRSKNKKQSLPAKRGATALSAASPGSLRRSLRSKAN